jgi:hypothetical protein
MVSRAGLPKARSFLSHASPLLRSPDHHRTVGLRVQVGFHVSDLGRFRGDIAVETQHLTRLRERPDDIAAENDRIHLVQPVFDRGDDAEIAAAAAQAPVKIRIFLVARPQEPPIGGDDIKRGHIVTGEAEAAPQPAEAAAERETCRARVRYGARRGCKAKGGTFMIELA